LNDSHDLLRVLLELKYASRRHEMGRYGAEKMAREFSWETVARSRLRDYEAALSSRKPVPERSPARPFPEHTS